MAKASKHKPVMFDPEASDLMRLIEFGRLAREQVAAPLSVLGLAAGDDAVLFALSFVASTTDDALISRLQIQPSDLLPHLRRLVTLGMIARTDVTGAGLSGSQLTELGLKTRDSLLAFWQTTERDLLGPEGSKKRQWLRKRLTRYLDR